MKFILLSMKSIELIFPFDTPRFREVWEFYKGFRAEQHRFTFKSPKSEQMALKRWFKNMTEDEAIDTIEHSIANGWRGVFPEHKNLRGTEANGTSGAQQAFELLKQRYGVL